MSERKEQGWLVGVRLTEGRIKNGEIIVGLSFPLEQQEPLALLVFLGWCDEPDSGNTVDVLVKESEE